MAKEKKKKKKMKEESNSSIEWNDERERWEKGEDPWQGRVEGVTRAGREDLLLFRCARCVLSELEITYS